jgi:nucleoside 2-deoxyribosyltransferase
MSCPLCDLEETQGQNIPDDLKKFDCKRCGVFVLYEDTLEDLESILKEVKKPKYLISGYTRELNEAKRKPPILNSENIKLIANQAPTNPIEKIDKLLMNLANISSYPGQLLFLSPNYDYPLGYCSNHEEFSYFVKHLHKANLIEKVVGETRLTVSGWEKVKLMHKLSAKSDQVFIAMNFDEEFDSCYERGIEAALEETKYKSYRIDREEHADKIDDKILSEIKRSRFIIAEFTGQKHGVYFEAGYAFGLGIPVIWTCREDDLVNLHFDTRQYNHVVWATEEELKEKLINRIRVLIGENK